MYHFKEKSIFKEKNIFKENKGKQPQKNEVGKVGGGKRLKASRSEWTGGSRKRVKVTNKDEKKVPVISSSGEFVGKLIDQFLDDGDVESWHKGVVLKMFGRRKFLVRYNDCPDKLYSQPLFEKLKVRNFRVTKWREKILLVRVFAICKYLKMIKQGRIFGGMQR